MREPWTETTLGEVADINPRERIAKDAEVNFISMADMADQYGGVQSFAVRRNASGMKFRKHDTLIARITPCLENKKIGMVPDTVGEAVCQGSTEFIVARPHVGKLHHKYLTYLMQSDDFMEYAVPLMTGTTGRQRLDASYVKTYPIYLPPMPDQLRIVDLMGTIDAAIEAASDTLTATQTTLNEFLNQLHGETATPLGQLAAMRSGPSWSSDQESALPVDGSLPVLGITNTKADGRLHLGDKRYVTGIPESTMRLTQDSLIMIRTNGNRSRIGNVYRAVPEIVGHAVSAFQIAIEPFDSSMAAYIYWALRSPNVQSKISDAASGSTGLGNVAIGWLKNLALPDLSGSDREAFVELCESFSGVEEVLQEKLVSLKSLRTQLLSSLVAGHHRIPDSYDELVAAA